MSDHTLFGIHVIMDAYNCDKQVLDDAEKLTGLLYKLPEEMGMHRLNEPQVIQAGENNKKDPGGYSGFVMIAESHISFHTFPKRGFVTIDVYTCQEDIDTEALIKKLKTFFVTEDVDTHVIERGLRYPTKNLVD